MAIKIDGSKEGDLVKTERAKREMVINKGMINKQGELLEWGVG